jgi:non-ribosomal peptide synthase protein (TIGR01720 family)
VKEEMRRIPNNGIGYWTMSRRREEEELRRGGESEIRFNYLGQFDQVAMQENLFYQASESSGSTKDPLEKMPYLLDINGAVFGGRLDMNWTYDQSLHNANTIEMLAEDYMEELRAFIKHCYEPQSAAQSPSDFPAARLTEDQLKSLFSRMEAVGAESK